MAADILELESVELALKNENRPFFAGVVRSAIAEIEASRKRDVGGDEGGRKAISQPGMTETQFVVQIAGHIMREGSMLARRALPLASTAYDAFLRDCKVEFGDAAYAWDEAAAAAIGREYETRFWPAGRASGSVGQNVG